MIDAVRRSVALVERDGRRWLAVYFAVTVVAAALETFGVGMVFLFFQAALEPEKLRGLPGAAALLPDSLLADQARLIAVVSLVVFLVFVARTGVQLAVVWLAQDVRRRIQLAFARELFHGYLAQPYAWHLGRKPSELYFNVSSNTGAVAQNCVMGAVEMLGTGLLIVFFMVTLAWLKPLETAAALALIVGVAVVYLRVVHRRSVRWGEMTVAAGEASVRAVSEPLRGIKTVKVLGLEPYFHAILDARMARLLGMYLRQGLAQAAPRMLMELVLVTALLGAVTVALALGQTAAEIIPTMALFGAAAYRLVPAAARVAGLLQYFRFSEPALDIVAGDFAVIRAAPPAKPTQTRGAERFEWLRLKGVEFTYPAAERMVLAGVSAEIRRGELVALVGPSGSGKTTLVDIMLGLLGPTRGNVLLDDAELTERPIGLFGYVPQEPFVVEDTLRRNIAIGVPKDRIDEAAVLKAVEAAALNDVVARLPRGLSTPVGEGGYGLSGGERQRLGLARALYHDPEILILDEPTAALDSVTEAEVSRALHALRGRKTVVVIAHRLSTVRDFDKIVFLAEGKVAGIGTFAELYASAPGFRDMADRLAMTPTSEQAAASAVPALHETQ